MNPCIELGEKTESAVLVAYGEPGKTAQVPIGQMVVTLRLRYDDSDSMTDYFNSHAALGPAMALLVVSKQAETERLARKAVSLYPELQSINWEWHAEKYSMGHGNYLDMGGFELPKGLAGNKCYYRGGAITHGHWEVEFSRPYSEGQIPSLPCYKGYPGHAPTAAEPVSVTVPTVTRNPEKGGIEIRFPTKPSAAVIATLKEHGFRWSFHSACWWKKHSDQDWSFAQSICGQSTTPIPALSDDELLKMIG